MMNENRNNIMNIINYYEAFVYVFFGALEF